MDLFGFHINDLAASQGYRIVLNQSTSKSVERHLLMAINFSREIE